MAPEVGSVLVLHGLDGSGPEHWQSWLVGRLRERGAPVSYPDLPAADDPQPAEWERVVRDELAARPDSVVCHSLACLLWLRIAAGGEAPLARRVLLVAPAWREDLQPVARFLDHGADAAAVARSATSTAIVCSDADPYCPGGAVERFAQPLGLPAAIVPGGGHLNPESGFGPWPQAEAWALGDDAAFGHPEAPGRSSGK